MANRNDDIVKRLRDDCYECQQEAADEIERLREERDSVRRIWCEDTFKVGKSYRYDADGNPVLCKSPQEIAEGFEWDCFKENTDYLQDLG